MSPVKTLIIAACVVVGFGLAANSTSFAQLPAGTTDPNLISWQMAKNFQDGWKSYLKNFQDNWKSDMKVSAEAEYIQAMKDFQDLWANGYMRNFREDWDANMSAQEFQDRWANNMKNFQDHWKSNIKNPSKLQQQAMQDFQDQWKSYLKNFQDNWKSNVRR